MQSEKKNLQTQMINQNKWPSKRPFLPHVRVQTHIQVFPSQLRMNRITLKTVSVWKVLRNKRTKYHASKSVLSV